MRYQLGGQKAKSSSGMQQDDLAYDESDDILTSTSMHTFTPDGRKPGKLPFKALPTPAKSSQSAARSSFSG